MRAALESRCRELDRAGRPGPAEDILDLVGELVARYAPARSDEADAAVRIKWYMEALEDQPAWAVREAIGRWRRGLCGPHAYAFAPPEAVLRSVARDIAAAARGQAVGLRRLLEAEPVEEPSPERQAANRRRWAELMQAVSREIAARAAPPAPAAGIREPSRSSRPSSPRPSSPQPIPGEDPAP